MAQITLYLDEDTDTLVSRAAKAQGISKSRWVADAIRHYAHDTWPDECLALAGAFPDFPLREDLPAAGEDLPRIGF